MCTCDSVDSVALCSSHALVRLDVQPGRHVFPGSAVDIAALQVATAKGSLCSAFLSLAGFPARGSGSRCGS